MRGLRDEDRKSHRILPATAEIGGTARSRAAGVTVVVGAAGGVGGAEGADMMGWCRRSLMDKEE